MRVVKLLQCNLLRLPADSLSNGGFLYMEKLGADCPVPSKFSLRVVSPGIVYLNVLMLA